MAAAGSHVFTGIESKQHTTAGAAINLVTARPGYAAATREEKAAAMILVTDIATDPSNVVVTSVAGVQDTYKVKGTTLPFAIPLQCQSVDATTTSGVVLNAIYN